MNRRGFLSLFSAAPAVLIPVPAAASNPLERTLDGLKLAPTPMPEILVACMGPLCHGRSYTLNHTGYAVPQSQCACAMMYAQSTGASKAPHTPI
jgi:hypothetical protein